MNTPILPRLAWSVPAILLLLTAHQVFTAVQLQTTLSDGVETWAEVTRYERSDRKDITHVSMDLIVHLEDGSTFERRNLTLPYSIGHRVEADSLRVSVRPGSAQEVVITEIGGTHVLIAWSNAAMSFIAFIMALVGAIAWNRLVRKQSLA